MSIGETAQLAAVVLDQNGRPISGVQVSWLSNNVNIATVSGQGLVTAVGNGEAVITARAGSASATASVTVRQTAGSITIDPDMATLMSIGETVQLTATVLDQNGQSVSDAVVAWSSGDEEVATVSGQGLVTAVGNGLAVITARAGSASATASVTVRQTVVSITIDPDMATLMSIGQTVQLTASVLDQNGQPVSDAVVAWSSGDEEVATVSGQGLVTAVGNGTADITARAGGASATAMITVLVPRTDRDVLIAFYQSTGGEHWSEKANWNSVHPLETWFGVTVDADGRVTEIDLPNNNLRGTLTPELGYLEELTTLRVSHNQLTGHIPPELGMLTGLRHLVLSSNRLSGAIPAELGQLAGLEELALSFNRLSGSIPGELGGLTGLTRLSLSVNELDGPVPTALGRLKRLTSLRLDQNRLSGPIPREFAELTDLQSLVLADNQFTGTIPSSLSQLDDLTDLVLDHNRLEGQIPREIGRLASLRRLGLAGNRLSGAAPSELGQLAGLTHLHLFSNPGLAGILPVSYTNLKLEELLLEGTQLCVPDDVDYQAWLERIRVKTVATCSNLESNVLASLYNATNGHNWNDNANWLSDRPAGTWYGVTTDFEGRVTRIDLENNNLAGTVPGRLAGLSSLKSLNLSSNGFLRGPLPREFINLDLRELRLEDTRLCAPPDAEFQAWLRTIPSRSVTSCDDLDLNAAQALFALFNSTNGPEWNDRTNWASDAPLDEWYGVAVNGDGRITGLNLAGNNLVGSLPADLAVLPDLRRLDLSDNAGLTGPLPDSWTGMSLEYLWLEGTESCAPPNTKFRDWLDEIPEHSVTDCSETRPEWYVLGLLYNSTNGQEWTNNDNWLGEAPLDRWYGVTTDEDGRVTALDLSDNNLAGELPPGLGELAGLTLLNLADNHLTGSIPAELGSLANLNRLDLSGNRLSGPIPAGIGQLTRLKWLDLSLNRLSGSIPPELGQLTRLEQLDLAFNNLTGPIPGELGELARLYTLDLTTNNLSGPIPAELGRLKSLERLSLNLNGLSGPIPAELGRLEGLTQLYLDSNNLSGPIPAELGQLTRLWRLGLASNNLSGPIPTELGNLERLTALNASRNAISGRIPAELGQLSRLAQLDLSFNNLSGSIPHEFDRLRSLSILNLGSNPLLSGALDRSLTVLLLETLQLGGTALCVPTAPEFRAWLQGIQYSRVASCLPFTDAAAYLTQAAQSLSHPVPLVAGEAALLRVFITADPDVGASMPSVQAVFYNGNQVVHTEDIPGGDSVLPARIEEGALMHSANADIPGSVVMPGLEMVVHVEPAGPTDDEAGAAMRIPETGRLPLDVRTVPPFDLTLVPFLWMESPQVSVLEDTDGLTAEDDLFWQTRNLLPIADFDVEVREPVWTATDPLIHNSFKLLQETRAIRVLDGSDRYYMGILRAGGGQAELPGTSSVSVLEAEVIAHEIGHNLNLFHAPCGGAFGSDPHYPHGDGSIGSWGYDFRDGNLVAPDAPDLMSYCHPQWISEYGFTRALNYRETEPRQFAATHVSSKGLLLWGGVNEYGEPGLEPAFVVDAPASVPTLPGPYRLTGRSGDGSVLFALDFGMPELGDGEGNVFAFVVPVEPGWAERLYEISFTGPEGAESVGRDGDRGAALLLDRNTGIVRGILRDWLDPLSVSPSVRTTLPEPGLEIVVSPGVPDADSW